MDISPRARAGPGIIMVIQETEIQVTIRHRLTPTGKDVIKKTDNSKFSKDAGKLEPLYVSGVNVKCAASVHDT